jgi:hypothetical protein
MALGRTPFNRPLAGACLLALVLALASCGDDDDESADATATAPTTTPAETDETDETAPEPAPDETETEPEPESEIETETEPETSPEDEPGGAGDEEPARTLALLTGDGGRIMPRVIRVPAYISIRVELRSADGEEYGLLFSSETSRVRINVSGELSSVSSTVDGLRPGEAITGMPLGAGNPVRIEATAEPGP